MTRSGTLSTGADPPYWVDDCRRVQRARQIAASPWRMTLARECGSRHSERCCGIPASRARTSVSRYRRWPPSVRMDVSLPALAHRVTVFGSTRNIVATSAGVSSGYASGVRAAILRPLLLDRNFRSLRSFLAWRSLQEPVVVSHMVYRDHIAITSGDKSTTRRKVFLSHTPATRRLAVTERKCSDT